MKTNGGFWLVVAGLLGLWMVARMRGEALPEPGELHPYVLREPEQSETERKPFRIECAGKRYTVQPVYAYEIYGLVVSYHDSGSVFDFYHRMSGDSFNLRDLALTWGRNAESGIYRKGEFRNQDFTAWVSFAAREDWTAFRTTEFSNNHLVTEKEEVIATIGRMKTGDQVHIKGYLAEYSTPPNYHRGTSTSRSDSGSHACETIYVTEANVLAPANGGWRTPWPRPWPSPCSFSKQSPGSTGWWRGAGRWFRFSRHTVQCRSISIWLSICVNMCLPHYAFRERPVAGSRAESDRTPAPAVG